MFKINTTMEEAENRPNFHNFSRVNFTAINISTVESFLNFWLSKKPVLYQPPTHIVVLLYTLYGAICAIAFFGNMIVLWLVLFNKKMWTVTNMFICNLAFADIIMAVVIVPFHFQAALYQRWDLPFILCQICPFAQVLSVNLSVWTLSAVALHRYHGIMSPFKPQITRKCAACILGAMWTLCVLVAAPTAYDYRIDYRQSYGTIIFHCKPDNLPDNIRLYYNQSVVILQYFLPLFIITAAYVRMGHELWRHQTPGNEDKSRDEQLLKKKKKVTKMFAVVVFMFGSCWFPYQSYNFLSNFFPSINEFSHINMIWFASHWLAMSNSCYNPFIYGIYSDNFKKEFRKRFFSRVSRSRQESTEMQNV